MRFASGMNYVQEWYSKNGTQIETSFDDYKLSAKNMFLFKKIYAVDFYKRLNVGIEYDFSISVDRNKCADLSI